MDGTLQRLHAVCAATARLLLDFVSVSLVCFTLRPKAVISRDEQNRYTATLLTARLIKFYGGLGLRLNEVYGGG